MVAWSTGPTCPNGPNGQIVPSCPDGPNDLSDPCGPRVPSVGTRRVSQDSGCRPDPSDLPKLPGYDRILISVSAFCCQGEFFSRPGKHFFSAQCPLAWFGDFIP